MKYYVYISDAKVNMLLPQIPKDVKRKIATEFKFDLKILSASRKTEVEDPDDRITRLEAVCDYIRNYRNVGSVDDPDEWIDDDLSMKWGSLANDYSGSTPPLVIYFAGQTERTICALGGSMKHVVGNASPAMPSSGYSHVTGILMLLAHELKIVAPPVKLFGPSMAQMVFSGMAENEIDWGKGDMSTGTDTTFAQISMLQSYLTVPPQKVDFLAKRLLYTPPTEKRKKAVLLATPIYVALNE